MKIVASFIIFSLPIFVFSQDVTPIKENAQGQAVPVSPTVISGPKLIPVYDPTPRTGPVAVEISYRHMEKCMKAAFPDKEFKSISINEASMDVLDSKGKPIKLRSIGVGVTKPVKDVDAFKDGLFYFYLPEATAELPKITFTTQFGPVVICESKVDPEIDPATLPRQTPIKLLGFQPAAPLLSGGTGSAYQLALDLPISNSLKLDGVLSSSFLDKQAMVNFGIRPNGEGGLAFDLTANQLGTNQLLRIGSESSGQLAILPTKNYKGQLSHPIRMTSGLYFAKQLRLDDRISGGASTGSGIYASSAIGFQNFGSGGFSSYFANLGVYLFPGSSANQFGVRSFEFAYDFGTIFPLSRPTKTRTGYADDGYFLKLGLLGGVQPGNGFGYVQGLRFDIVRSF